MMTPQEIREITFSKSFGGYKAAEVDIFIDQCAETVETLLMERAELNHKLELLADKIMEYREKEAGVQTALIDAHCAGERAIQEAKQKADTLLAEAEAQAERLATEAGEKVEANQKAAEEKVATMLAEAEARVAELDQTTDQRRKDQERQIKRELAHQQRELDELTKAASDFRSKLLTLYRDHLRLIEVLPAEEDATEQATAGANAQAEDEASASVEPTAIPEPEAPIADDFVELTAEQIAAIPFSEELLIDEQDEPSAEQQPTSRFNGLQFGENYTISED